jgi:hypothetical protein
VLIRTFGLRVRSRAGALALGLAALAVGGVFLAFGLALLLGLGAIGLALIAAAALYRRLTGRGPLIPRAGRSAAGLDPSMEVFPPDRNEQGPLGASRPHDALQPTKALDDHDEDGSRPPLRG